MHLKISAPSLLLLVFLVGCEPAPVATPKERLVVTPKERLLVQEQAFLNGTSCSVVKRINCRPRDVFHPFTNLVGVDLGKMNKALDEKFGSGFMDPWAYGAECIDRLRYAEITGQADDATYALKVLKNLHAIFLKNQGSFPHPAYGSFPDGWVSSMDIPVVALCAQIAVEMYGDFEYQNMRDDFIKVIDRETKNGGFYLPEPGGMGWFSEYSSTSTTLENEMYVLNGFFVSLQSVLMLAQSLGDEHLMELYLKNLKKYKAIADKFWFADDAWSYYMLKPREANQPHYMIYETKQLNALQLLDPNPTYERELQRHRAALKKMLPVYSLIDEHGRRNVLIYRAILDPYHIDIYQTKIVIKDSAGAVVSTLISGNANADYNEMHFMKSTVPANAVSFDFYSINSFGIEFKLYSGKLTEIAGKSNAFFSKTNWKQLKVSADYDGQLDGDVVFIDDSRSTADEASIWMTLEGQDTRLFAKDDNRYFGIELASSAEKNIQLILYNKDSKSAQRSYTKLTPGKNLILLHWAGFYGIDDLEQANTLRLRIFSNPSPVATTAQIRIEGLVEFENEVGIFNYMKKTDYRINLVQ